MSGDMVRERGGGCETGLLSKLGFVNGNTLDV